MTCELQDSFPAKYSLGSSLGKGAFGEVMSCTEMETRTCFACKCVDVQALSKTREGPNIKEHLRNEISIMSYLNGHPNIVSLKDVYESGPNGHLVMVRARLRGPGETAIQSDVRSKFCSNKSGVCARGAQSVVFGLLIRWIF